MFSPDDYACTNKVLETINNFPFVSLYNNLRFTPITVVKRTLGVTVYNITTYKVSFPFPSVSSKVLGWLAVEIMAKFFGRKMLNHLNLSNGNSVQI